MNHIIPKYLLICDAITKGNMLLLTIKRNGRFSYIFTYFTIYFLSWNENGFYTFSFKFFSNLSIVGIKYYTDYICFKCHFYTLQCYHSINSSNNLSSCTLSKYYWLYSLFPFHPFPTTSFLVLLVGLQTGVACMANSM